MSGVQCGETFCINRGTYCTGIRFPFVRVTNAIGIDSFRASGVMGFAPTPGVDASLYMTNIVDNVWSKIHFVGSGFKECVYCGYKLEYKIF